MPPERRAGGAPRPFSFHSAGGLITIPARLPRPLGESLERPDLERRMLSRHSAPLLMENSMPSERLTQGSDYCRRHASRLRSQSVVLGSPVGVGDWPAS